MLENYIEERFPRYFEFGIHKNGDVDVASTHRNTVATVSQEHSNNLIEDRDDTLNMLVKISNRLNEINPGEFKKIWYES